MKKARKQITVKTFKYSGKGVIVEDKQSVDLQKVENLLVKLKDAVGYDKSASSSGRFMHCLFNGIVKFAIPEQQKSLDEGICHYTIPDIAVGLVASVQVSNDYLAQQRKNNGVKS